MRPRKRRPDPQKQAEILARFRKEQAAKQQGYRERALALFPHVCARCGREFSDKNLRELTVHHKDHDHTNNPPDGSNWELLCLYCHDDEHQDPDYQGKRPADAPEERLGHNPFEGLKGLVSEDEEKRNP